MTEHPVWHRFTCHRGTLFGLALLSLIVLSVALGPVIWPLPPDLINPSARMQGPSLPHPLGTDQLGRDMLARLLAGGRLSLAVGMVAMLLSLSLGVLVGVLSGLYRWLDGPLMRLTDLFLSLPLLPLVLVMVMLFRDSLSAAFGPENGLFLLLVIAIALTSWMQTARLVRAEVLSLKEADFILAARASGTRQPQLILRHILPNIASPILVSASLGITSAILTESALSFLGLGFPPDLATWGRLLRDGTAYLGSGMAGPAIWPGVAISATVLSVTYIGDGLRDALDPKARHL